MLCQPKLHLLIIMIALGALLCLSMLCGCLVSRNQYLFHRKRNRSRRLGEASGCINCLMRNSNKPSSDSNPTCSSASQSPANNHESSVLNLRQIEQNYIHFYSTQNTFTDCETQSPNCDYYSNNGIYSKRAQIENFSRPTLLGPVSGCRQQLQRSSMTGFLENVEQPPSKQIPAAAAVPVHADGGFTLRNKSLIGGSQWDYEWVKEADSTKDKMRILCPIEMFPAKLGLTDDQSFM